MTGILPLGTSAARIVAVLGEDRAIALFLAVGGTPWDFSANPKPDNKVVAAIGMEGALALWQEFGPSLGRIPIAKEWIAQVWHARGVAILEIARRLHASDQTVRRWTQQRRTEARAQAAEWAERRAAEKARQSDLIDWIEGRSSARS